MPAPGPGEVRLRIAGLYYDKNFLFRDLENVLREGGFGIRGVAPVRNSILALLELASIMPNGIPVVDDEAEIPANETNVKSFGYVFERRPLKMPDGMRTAGLSLTSVVVEHGKNFGRTLGDNSRIKGIYQLTEIAIPSGVVAWQSYVYRGGVSVTQDAPPPLEDRSTPGYSPVFPANGGFTTMDQYELRERDEVIWRQVAILRGPSVIKIEPPDPPVGQ